MTVKNSQAATVAFPIATKGLDTRSREIVIIMTDISTMMMVPMVSTRPSANDFVPYQKARANAAYMAKNTRPNCNASRGAVLWPCVLAVMTHLENRWAIWPSAPQAAIMRMDEKASLAIDDDLVSALVTFPVPLMISGSKMPTDRRINRIVEQVTKVKAQL